jgi:hypothetical protein
VLWVGNARKNSYLFLLLLRRLHAAFPLARKLHVVLDNYGIHSSRLVQRALTEEFGGRWRELHANVTRNHRCRTLPELLRNVAAFLRRASPFPGTKVSLMRASKRKAV